MAAIARAGKPATYAARHVCAAMNMCTHPASRITPRHLKCMHPVPPCVVHSEAVWREPRPPWSAFREDSFGIGSLRFVNASHAHYAWNRSACEGTDDPSHINFNRTCESIMWDKTSFCPQGDCRDNSVFASIQSDSMWIVRPRSLPGAVGSCPSDLLELTPKTACTVVELTSSSAPLSSAPNKMSFPALVGTPPDTGLKRGPGQTFWWVWIIITAIGGIMLGATLTALCMLRKLASSTRGREQLLPDAEDTHASNTSFYSVK